MIWDKQKGKDILKVLCQNLNYVLIEFEIYIYVEKRMDFSDYKILVFYQLFEFVSQIR